MIPVLVLMERFKGETYSRYIDYTNFLLTERAVSSDRTYSRYIDYTNFLLTERAVSSDRDRRARFVQKDRGAIFLCTYRASELNKKFITWHL